MAIIKNEVEAKKALENLRSTAKGAIGQDTAQFPREKIRVEPMEIYK